MPEKLYYEDRGSISDDNDTDDEPDGNLYDEESDDEGCDPTTVGELPQLGR